jgi:hypothetical protein
MYMHSRQAVKYNKYVLDVLCYIIMRSMFTFKEGKVEWSTMGIFSIGVKIIETYHLDTSNSIIKTLYDC